MKQVYYLNYRQAEQYDKEEIKEVLVASFTPTYAYYAQKSFVNLKNVLVAADEGKVIGVINWRIFEVGEKKIGYLFWLAVQPEYRRMGIAKKLINDVIKKIQQEIGLAEIYAAVEKNNIPSRRLIESLGFTFISRPDMKKKYGSRCLRLYFQMMLLPKEDLFIKLL
jgi:ribosomal protein S18 acetylase RimI-like enzyme